MAKVAVDIEALLAPIPGENPAGENLKYEGLFDEIRNARRADDENLDQGDWKTEVKTAEWETVVTLASDALANRTKDLQLGVWLADGLIRTNGFDGLRDSLALLRGLLERYWDQLYPENDEGDLEARGNTLAWLDREAAIAIKNAPITNSRTGHFSTLGLEEAKRNLSQKEPAGNQEGDAERAEAIRADREKAARYEEEHKKAERATPRAFYEDIAASLTDSAQELAKLDRVVDEKFGNQAPGLRDMIKAIEVVKATVDKTLKERPVEGGGAAAGEESASAGPGVAGGPAGPMGSVAGRTDALRRLADVADYFRRTEPHSPVSYLVQRAIRWGEMPLSAWLDDVIKDPASLDHLRETLGIKQQAAGGEEPGQ
jgi:type VI secretion system protein ImpA